jgi:Lhr-like helicase
MLQILWGKAVEPRLTQVRTFVIYKEGKRALLRSREGKSSRTLAARLASFGQLFSSQDKQKSEHKCWLMDEFEINA